MGLQPVDHLPQRRPLLRLVLRRTRWCVVSVDDPTDCLPLDGDLPGFDGTCPPSRSAAEHGLQATALRGLRCVKAAFPAIVSMGGRGGRPIATSDHCTGLAVDFMIPKWNTKRRQRFGWRVARWVQAHAKAS